MPFRYDAQHLTPQQQAIIRQREENDRLRKEEDTRRSKEEKYKYFLANNTVCIDKMNFTLGKEYKIKDENEFIYMVYCDEGVAIPISKNSDELVNFKIIEK